MTTPAYAVVHKEQCHHQLVVPFRSSRYELNVMTVALMVCTVLMHKLSLRVLY